MQRGVVECAGFPPAISGIYLDKLALQLIAVVNPGSKGICGEWHEETKLSRYVTPANFFIIFEGEEELGGQVRCIEEKKAWDYIRQMACLPDSDSPRQVRLLKQATDIHSAMVA